VLIEKLTAFILTSFFFSQFIQEKAGGIHRRDHMRSFEILSSSSFVSHLPFCAA